MDIEIFMANGKSIVISEKEYTKKIKWSFFKKYITIYSYYDRQTYSINKKQISYLRNRY